ncbi:MAG: GH36 C-terminal domain-containing protein [Chloroflexi bacterium]|nr:GH36 C-terminal domain-containing protein [Chloroflexota bacterium]
MNRNVTEPGSVTGKAIWRAHAAGVYGLMDRLRQKYPIFPCRPDQSEAVYSVAVHDHLIGRHRPPACLRGLNPQATYAIFDRHERAIAHLSGADLMAQGIPGDTYGPAGTADAAREDWRLETGDWRRGRLWSLVGCGLPC